MTIIHFPKTINRNPSFDRQTNNQKICESILLNFQITPNNRELILLIGNGYESSNLEALLSWIETVTKDIPTPYKRSDYEFVRDQLDTLINSNSF